MSFFKDVSFAGATSDLIQFLRTPRQHRWLLVIVACLPPAFIITIFNLDVLRISQPGPPEVVYIESWPADRSIKEIVASNLARQKLKDEQQEKVREAYKALGRASGMDVDRIEREAEEYRAKKAEAAKAAVSAGAAK